MARTYNTIDNQGANVSLGRDPSNLLYQFAAGGGGYTQLQRSATDLGGMAGEAIATQQILQQGVQAIGGAVNTGLNIYTDQKARQFKMKMLDTLQATEKNLLGIDDPIKHKEIYQQTLDGLKTELSESGILKKDDLDSFNELLSQRQNYYSSKNDQLTKQQLFNTTDVNTNKTIGTLFSVGMDFPESISLIKHQYKDNYNDALKAGFSETEAKSVAQKTIIKMVNAAANSMANPLNQSVFYRNLADKDKDGKWLYFNDELDGEDRQRLLETIKYQGGNDEYKRYDLDIELNKYPSKKQILKSIVMDDQQKARLLSKIDHATQQQSINNNKAIVDKVLKDNILLNKTEFNNVLNVQKDIPDDIRQVLLEKHIKNRDEFQTGDAITKYMESDPSADRMPRDIMIQRIRSHGGNQDSILTNQEMNLVMDHLNNSNSVQDKLNVINFKTLEMQRILENMNIDQSQQGLFVQKYKFDILRQMKNNIVSSEEKTAIEMMSRQTNNNVKNTQIATQLLKDYYTNEGKTIPVKTKVDIDKFKTDPVISFLNSYKATQPIADQYIDAFKKSGISKNDFIDALGLGTLQNNKYNIVYNKNDFNKKELLSSLDEIVNNDIYYPQKLKEDKYTFNKIKAHGKWISQGVDKGFVYVYQDIPILEVDLDYSNQKPQLKVPLIIYDQEIFNENKEMNQVYPDGIKNNIFSK